MVVGPPYPTALIFGVPGAGKGTQGEILTRVPGFFHLSTGVIFRKLGPDTPEGVTVREYYSRGELAPDELTVQIWKTWLESQRFTSRFRPREHLLLLDGLPRTVAQCKMIEDHADVKAVIHLSCDDEEMMIERIRRRAILENRPDDASEEVTRRRFEVYHEQTRPVLDHYPSEIVHAIESTGIYSEVLRNILDVLVPVLKANFPRTADDAELSSSIAAG